MYRYFTFIFPSEALAWANCPPHTCGATVERNPNGDGFKLTYWY